MIVGTTVIWYMSSVPLRNSAPLPYFSTRTTPRVLPTAKPSAARLSICFGVNRSSTFHMVLLPYGRPPRRLRRGFLRILASSFGGFLPQPPYFSGGQRRGFTFGRP